MPSLEVELFRLQTIESWSVSSVKTMSLQNGGGGASRAGRSYNLQINEEKTKEKLLDFRTCDNTHHTSDRECCCCEGQQ